MELSNRLAFLFFFWLIITPRIGNCQEAGIKFESGLSWQEIQAKAKAEGKAIFMDCYATWCGPCKYMSDKIFTLKEVGEYFNSNFINVAVQMDQTANDLETVRQWYGDAKSIKNKYEINSYPTYLFFSSDGRIIHQFIGSTQTGADFIAKASSALDPDKQYFTLIPNWKEHKEDSSFLLNTLIAAKDAGDFKNAKTISEYYINCLKAPITKYNIELLYPFIDSKSDKGFQLYLENAFKIDQMMNTTDYVEYRLGTILFKEEIAPLFTKGDISLNWKKICSDVQYKYSMLNKEALQSTLDTWFQNFIGVEIDKIMDKQQLNPEGWATISRKLKKRFPEYDCGLVIFDRKVKYYTEKKMWPECCEAALSCLEQYRGRLNNTTINNICWNIIFMHSKDKKILTGATRHMMELAKNSPEDCDILDTYANLLYKTGNQKDAILLENKVISIAAKNSIDDKEWRNNLMKMEKGEPTWEDNPPAS